MRLGDVLDRPRLRLVPLTGDDGRERGIARVHVTDLPDPGRYLAAGDLVLTGLMWHRDPADSEVFVTALARAGVAALGVGDARTGSVPADLVAACRRHGVPLFEVPVEVAFGDIVDAVDQALWAHRAGGLVALLGRHRGLVAAMAAGARLADLLPAVAADLGVRCWVLSATGRVIAGTAALPAARAADIAREFLTAERLPRRVAVGGRPVTISGVRGRPEHRLASWVLACEDAGEEPGEPRGIGVRGSRGRPAGAPATVADELVSVVALERAHLDEADLVERRLAEQLREALVTPGDAAELRAALLASRLAPAATFLVVVATLRGLRAPDALAPAIVAELVRPAAPYSAVAGLPDLGVPGVGVPGVGVPGPPRGGRTGGGPAAAPDAAPAAGGVLAVLAVTPERAAEAVERLREAAGVLAPGLGAGRLCLGVSAPATGAAALPGAFEQARHAHRSGCGAAVPVTVIAAGELASHALLLAGVPADTRRAFRGRLLDPLAEYDRTHATELVRTLDEFLDCGGSWSRCAQRLHLHVNTLRYRIGRIEQLTGRDLARFEDRVDLFLALRLPDR
jgi:hypothetical protein